MDGFIQFFYFCISNEDLSDILMSHAVTFLKQDQSSKSLLIWCLASWGKLHYHLNAFQNAVSKLQEAKEQCLSLNNQGPLYGHVDTDQLSSFAV